MKNVILLVVLFVLPAAGFSATIHVPKDHATIQAAITAAVDGDTVLVDPGVYVENIDFSGKNIIVASRYAVDGNPDHILNTVIDGSQSPDPDIGSCVMITSGEGPSAVLEGFTLTGGRGTKWLDIHYMQYYREGGGILIELSSPTIRSNLIIGNEAIDDTGMVSAGGGGIRIGDGDPLIQNNIVMNNLGLYGGGIVLNFAKGTLRNNVIYRNRGGEDYGGSGIWTYKGGATLIENNTIVENHSVRRGGGIRVSSTTVDARNNIFWGNTAVQGGDQIYLIMAGASTFDYCDVQGGWTGQGNIDQDPLFDEVCFLLDPLSPCVDGGDPDVLFCDPEDPGNPGYAEYPSMGALANDMGAYGGPGRTLFPLFDLLKADAYALSSASGGTVNFTLATGCDHANRNYLLLGSASGVQPGILLPGGGATLPLAFDFLTLSILVHLNTPVFTDFLGTLNGDGLGYAQLNLTGPLPPGTGIEEIHFAFCLAEPWDFASYPVPIEID